MKMISNLRETPFSPTQPLKTRLDKPHLIAFNLNWDGSVLLTVSPNISTFNACLPAFGAPLVV
jgi:hypothetical protein